MSVSTKNRWYDNCSFDYRLVFVMRIVDISAIELSRRSKLTPATISRFCAGTALPSYESMVKLCETLKCDSNFLLGLTNVLQFRK